MKKSKTILLTIISCLTIFLSTGCFIKTKMTSQQFKEIFEQKGYEVIEITNEIEEKIYDYNYVKEAYAAKKSNYQIEFYEIIDEDYAKVFFDKNKKMFEKSKSNMSYETSNNLINNERYTLKTSGKYMVISRIENTIIYVNSSPSNKKQIDTILKEIKY